MTAATLAAGLLTTSTYQAIYTPIVSSVDRRQILKAADQTGNPIVSSAQADYAFRLLNALSLTVLAAVHRIRHPGAVGYRGQEHI